MVKFLIADSIHGGATFEEIHNNAVQPNALDRNGNATRICLRSTAVRVEHLGKADEAEFVGITYLKDGQLQHVRARCVILASGGWVNRHIVRDIPLANLRAYEQFHHASTLVVNIAATNWRFLYKLGITGARWFDGLGFTTNIRQQMTIGSYRPKLDPDTPNALTLYIPFQAPGKLIAEQTSLGRAKLFSTSYREYESQVREQLIQLFGASGFDPSRDIAGIILNPWGI